MGEEKAAALKTDYEKQRGAEQVSTDDSPNRPKKMRNVATPEKKEVVKGAGVKRKNDTPKKEEPVVDAAVLALASKLGFEGALKNLTARADVIASGKSAQELLDALKASNGLVNAAKHALLGQ